MAKTIHAVSKSPISKWFSNKSTKLSSFNLRRTKSSNTSSPSSSPPLPPPASSSSSPVLDQTPKNDMIMKKLTSNHKEINELRQVFRCFDENGDGKISALELRSYFGSIGEYMSHEQAKAVIDDFDENGDNLMDFQEFLNLMKKGNNSNHNHNNNNSDNKSRDVHEDDDLKSAFEMFELENGCITPRSVQRMLCRLGDTRSYDECKAMVRVFDEDGNGVLDFKEFHNMMTAN